MSRQAENGGQRLAPLPKGWRATRVKRICSMHSGDHIAGDEICEEGEFPVYGGNDLRGYYPKYNCEGPMLIVGRQGALCGNVHRINGKFWATEHALITTLTHFDNLDYLYYLFTDLNFNQYVSQSAAQPGLAASKILQVETVLPPRPEQERIAAFLDEKCAAVDKAIEVKRKQLESVEPQWANLLHNVTLRGIRPSRLQKTTNAIIEKIPVGWKLKRLRYIGRCQNGISKDGQYFGYGFPFVTYGDVYNNMALPVVASGLVESTEDERIRYSVKRGDVFFTRTSETADEVGFSSVCLKTIPDATFAGFVIRVRPVTEDLLPEFAQYYFRNPFVSQYFAKEMMVVTRASLNQDILKSLPVLIPPRDEQVQIAKYLGERRSYFDSLAANLRKQIEILKQYRKSLIHEYVTGVRRVV